VNSHWDVVPHWYQRNQELFSLEVNDKTIIFSVKQCSHYEEIFRMVSRYLVRMVDPCRLHTLLPGI